MDNIVNELIDQGLGKMIDKRRDPFILTDDTYLRIEQCLSEVEDRYGALDLTEGQRKITDMMIDRNIRLRDRIADLSYMAGIRDAVRFLQAAGLLGEQDVAESDGPEL